MFKALYSNYGKNYRSCPFLLSKSKKTFQTIYTIESPPDVIPPSFGPHCNNERISSNLCRSFQPRSKLFTSNKN